MRSLGLDPSLTGYGWCVYDSQAERARDKLVASGHEGTLPDTVPPARFMHFRSLVLDLLRRFSVGIVGIESPAYDGGPFSETHFGLMQYSLEAAFIKRRDVVLFDPTTVKKLTGKASASKQDMQRFVQLDRMSSEVVQSDEADAYCIARSAARFSMLRSGDLKPEDLTPDEIHTYITKSKVKKSPLGSRKVRTGHIFRENKRFFAFSRVPEGDVCLPARSKIDPSLLAWLESDVTSRG